MTTADRPTRFRMQPDLDGDLSITSLTALGPAQPVPPTTPADASAHLADLGIGPAATDTHLMAALETHAITRSPVAEHAKVITRADADTLLAVAARWLRLRTGCAADLQMINTACKITGAVLLHHRDHPDPRRAGQLATVGDQLLAVTTELHHDLTNRLHSPGTHRVHPDPIPAFRTPHARIAVLAPPHSHTAAALVPALAAAQIPVTLIGWQPCAAGTIPERSHYAHAWYPDHGRRAPAAPAAPDVVAGSWSAAAEALSRTADLTVLAGMPIVPPAVLAATRLGAVNAHNGALPTLRGMDAVGWAILTGEPIMCTAHIAAASVDTGDLLGCEPLTIQPSITLKNRVREAQVRLLVATCAHVTGTGELPTRTPQQGTGMQYYRLHPHLKRLLDTTVPETQVGAR